MSCAARQAASTRLMQALARPRTHHQIHSLTAQHHPASSIHRTLTSTQFTRNASSSQPQPPPPKKGIVLEQPDKFRPPSHGARRNARSTTSMFGGGAAYNQGMTAREREASGTRDYPNMFPAPGTRMFWFLTTRWVHVTLTMAILFLLAFTSLITTWSKTSPFSHLIPRYTMMFSQPFTYFSEVFSVYRLHLEYTTQQTAEKRRQGILDAQKRRLYRRAHGMEDLNADEVSGVDVRGLVEWDDGLTKPERERGGQYKPEIIGANMMEMGQRPGEEFNALLARKRGEQAEAAERSVQEKVEKEKEAARLEEERLVRIRARRANDVEEPRRRKVWFGIWG